MRVAIEKECDRIIGVCNNFVQPRETFLSMLISPCIERGRFSTEGGAKYGNYGIHGVGLSNAADALEAIKKAVFDDKTVSKDELIAALETNFEGREDLRQTLLALPKTGNNNEADDRLCFLRGLSRPILTESAIIAAGFSARERAARWNTCCLPQT
ncbi:MAG: pyruvate formate lyase family protein [Christensenellales bacterium]